MDKEDEDEYKEDMPQTVMITEKSMMKKNEGPSIYKTPFI
jgi:hypothetical protein